VLLLLLITVILVSNHLSVQAQLASSRTVWENFEPRLTAYRSDKQGLTTSGRIMNLFDGWQESQSSFLSLLNEVQHEVPRNIQFTRLSVRAKSGGSLYKTAEELALNYSLSIDGIAVGDAAESDVLSLQKDLLAGKTVGSSFSSLKLASMRKSTGTDGQTMRQFQLVAAAQEGEKK